MEAAWEHLEMGGGATMGLSCALFRSQECKLQRVGRRDDATPRNPKNCAKALGKFGTTTQHTGPECVLLAQSPR